MVLRECRRGGQWHSGILMSCTGVDPLTARTDLLATAGTGRIDVFHLATAIVGLCADLNSGVEQDAINVAQHRWGGRLHRAFTLEPTRPGPQPCLVTAGR